MKYILFILLVALAARLSAQRDSLESLHLGLQYSYSYNQITFDPARLVDYLPGSSLYLVVRHSDLPLVDFQGELGLEQSGWQEYIDTLGGWYSRQQTAITLQVFTQLSIGRSWLQPILQAGPYLSAPIGNTEQLPAGFTPGPESVYGQPLPFRLNYGLIGGLGFELHFSRISLQASGRYRQGFSDIIRLDRELLSSSRRDGFGAQATLFYRLW